ncbi:hypothetical protein [Paenibacillus glufosinatiresistens]|uniref:hypothetical protein n=1 Tax=Paenibacillus glufosinatiresistens TaxID=3070657 RepID=UPI00286DDA81|nr:hypothetical protein [Paenibacillus sp. YX.27]
MLMINETCGFNFVEFESESEFKEYVNSNKSIFINESSSYRKRFFSLYNKKKDINIGIYGGANGISPTIIFLRKEPFILISSDEVIGCIDIEQKCVKWLTNFDSIVYTLQDLDDGSILIVCELVASRINYDGKVLWKYFSKDVITNYEFHSSFIKIITEEDEHEISLQEGNFM